MIGNRPSFSLSDTECFSETLCEGELLGLSHRVRQSRREEAGRELWILASGTVNRHLEEGFFHTKELQVSVGPGVQKVSAKNLSRSRRAISTSPEDPGQFQTK